MIEAADHDEFLRNLETAMGRSASKEAPRALPAKPEPKAKGVVALKAGNTGDFTQAARRIATRDAFGTAAKVFEAEGGARAKAEVKIRTRAVDVDSPYGKVTNKTDRVEKVVDTIEHMLKSHQIDRGQEAVARMVQDAWAVAHGSMRCVLAPAAGGGGGSGSLTDAQVRAGEILNDVRKTLGELDAPIIVRVCGMGLSVEEVARMVFGIRDGMKVKDYQSKHVGMRLRMALQALARRWRIEVRRGKVFGSRGAVAGHQNEANYGTLSESERERLMPLRHAAERRERKSRGKRRAKTQNRKNAGKAIERA